MVHASPLEYALIGLLKQKPQSGYDLRKSFASTPMRHFSDSPGSVYPALRRLQSRKWIGAAALKGGRNRQVFHVTVAGSHAFVVWLQQMPTREDIIWRLPEVMIRFAFQGVNISRDITLEFLAELERHLVAYLRELREYAKQSGMAHASDTGAMAYDSGIKGYETQLAWTKRARKRLMEASL